MYNLDEIVINHSSPISIEVPNEFKLKYKKSYMHMLNKIAFTEGAIDENLFRDVEAMIAKIEKV